MGSLRWKEWYQFCFKNSFITNTCLNQSFMSASRLLFYIISPKDLQGPHTDRNRKVSNDKPTSDKNPATKPLQLMPSFNKIIAAQRNWTCQSNEAEAEQKFYRKVSSTILMSIDCKLYDFHLMFN